MSSNEQWPRGRWLSVDPFRDFLLPPLPGVYVIFIGNEVAYVGQSCDIRARFREHKFQHGYGIDYMTPWGEFPNGVPCTMKIKLSRRIGDWAMQEIRLIMALKPRFNQRTLMRRAWARGRRVA